MREQDGAAIGGVLYTLPSTFLHGVSVRVWRACVWYMSGASAFVVYIGDVGNGYF